MRRGSPCRHPGTEMRRMAEDSGSQIITGINWTGIVLGTILVAMIAGGLQPIVPRVLAVMIVTLVTVYLSIERESTEVENPVLEQMRGGASGLDRRKYGRLRSQTDKLLDHIRRMNRIAVDAREGKVTQAHARSEIDRIAEMMRDQIDDIRKAAGVPTPVVDPSATSGRVVRPRGQSPPSSGGAAGTRPESR